MEIEQFYKRLCALELRPCLGDSQALPLPSARGTGARQEGRAASKGRQRQRNNLHHMGCC